MQKTDKTQEQEKTISKPEDAIIRNWIKLTYKIKVPQLALWRMTPAEAVEYLKDFNRGVFSKLTEDDISTAARREE